MVGIGEQIVLAGYGEMDPANIVDYQKTGGYQALEKAVRSLKPEDILDEVKNSNLRGRGGAAFPTGIKWSFTAKAQADQKYIICNADEGEPGTYKDRYIMEGVPHRLLEGMALAGYAVGACKGYIYVRGEYRKSIESLRKAVRQAEEQGVLGDKIFRSGFNFSVELREGAGAYICGEETALIESIEGKRGEPRIKPPYPGVSGLWGKPTVVNNVETLANIPSIIAKGAAWFRGFGTENSVGTKLFTLLGHIKNKCVVEAPFGVSLQKLIVDIGGGVEGGKIKMIQIGGGSSPCITGSRLDIPLDYEHLGEIGTAVGSGAIFAVSDKACMVDMALNFAKFFRHESCGKCTPCRIGTAQIHGILENIASFNGSMSALDLLDELGGVMKAASFCGLGQTAAAPLMSLIKNFRPEFEMHIKEKKCPTGICNSAAQKLFLAH
ncbi:MAG: NADH-quinone oxidoreductase subunit NuoF [Bacillota bacterium]